MHAHTRRTVDDDQHFTNSRWNMWKIGVPKCRYTFSVHTAPESNNDSLGDAIAFACNEFARLRGGAWGCGTVLSADVDTLVGRVVVGLVAAGAWPNELFVRELMLVNYTMESTSRRNIFFIFFLGWRWAVLDCAVRYTATN